MGWGAKRRPTVIDDALFPVFGRDIGKRTAIVAADVVDRCVEIAKFGSLLPVMNT